jgi:hypothetical protein
LHVFFLLFPLHLTPIFPNFPLFYFYFSPPTVAVVIHFAFPFFQHQRAISVDSDFINSATSSPYVLLSPCLFSFSIFLLVYRSTYFSYMLSFKCSQRFTAPTSINKCTVPILCFALLISCYMFRINCHHHGANTYTAKT